MENLLDLFLLVLLQCVLGFDNLLYISLESKRAPLDRQAYVRKLGIGIAIILRIALLFALLNLLEYTKNELFGFDFAALGGQHSGHFTLHSIIVLVGGVFIIYTSIKEIWHMMKLDEHEEISDKKKSSIVKVISWIVLMNLIFSFDSILSAIALTTVKWVMIVAIVISGALMIFLAERVSQFLEKNRMYEVLGLFVLFLVGIMLITEGGHLAHITLFDNEITPMNKTTFYFILAIMVVIDIVQGRYQKKLSRASEKHSQDITA